MNKEDFNNLSIIKISEGDKMNALNDALALLWASRIKTYSVDFLNNAMSFELESVDSGNIQNHSLEICQIRAFSFFNNTKDSIEEIWEPEPDDYLELTSISLISKTEQVIKSTDEKWVEQYGSSFNMCLELWSNLILVNTPLVIIDGVQYSI